MAGLASQILGYEQLIVSITFVRSFSILDMSRFLLHEKNSKIDRVNSKRNTCTLIRSLYQGRIYQRHNNIYVSGSLFNAAVMNRLNLSFYFYIFVSDFNR